MANRISGLASGLDIDSMVKVMLQPQQSKIDSLFRKKSLWGWKQDAYNSVNAKLAQFVINRKTDFGITTTSNGVSYDKARTSVTWLKTASVTNSTSTSGDVLTAKANTTAVDGKYKVNVKQVADNWSAASSEALEQLRKTKNVDGTDVAVENTIDNMFALGEGDVIDFKIETDKGKIWVTSDAANVSAEAKEAFTKGGGKIIELDLAKDNLSSLASKINAAGKGVSANFDSGSGRFFIQTAQTGESSTIKFTDSSRKANNEAINFIGGKDNLLKLKHEVQVTDENGNEKSELVDVMSGRVNNIKVLDKAFTATSEIGVDPSKLSDSLREQLGIVGTGNVLKLTITEGDKQITVGNDMTKQNDEGYIFINMNTDGLSHLTDKLNNAGFKDVKASFVDGKFSLETSESVTIKDESQLKLSTEADADKYGLLIGDNSLLKLQNASGEYIKNDTEYSAAKKDVLETIDHEGYAGKDAIIDFGVAQGIKQSSNEFIINGINLSIKNVGATEVQVSTDVTSAIDKIKTFVDEYNKLANDLNSQLKSKYDKSYQPLLDTERSEMSESDIKAWEEKAKTGLLRNDNAITTMLTNIRNNMFEPVTGVREDMNALYKIGINFDSYSTSAGGQLTIDEDKLREALLKDGNAVIDVLFKTQDNSLSKDYKANIEQSGAFTRLTMDITEGMKSIINIAGTGNNETLYRNVHTGIMLDFFTKNSGIADLQKEINTFTNSLTDLNDKYFRMQENYYKRYSVLESAVSNANMQSSWLSSAFSNG